MLDVDAVIRHVITELLDGTANNPGKVFHRAKLALHELRAEKEYKRPRQRELASELGVTEAAVSKRLSQGGFLAKLRAGKFSSKPASGGF